MPATLFYLHPRIVYRHRRTFLSILGGVALIFGVSHRANSQIVNGDFETGDLTGWTMYTTDNGSVGGDTYPVFSQFDITGSGTTSYVIKLQAGALNGYTGTNGGGVRQTFYWEGGDIHLTVNVACGSAGYSNTQGDRFDLLFDGVQVATITMGPVSSQGVERAILSASLSGVVAGSYEVKVVALRDFGVTFKTPFAYFDDIQINATAVPEPSAIALITAAGSAALVFRFRKRPA